MGTDASTTDLRHENRALTREQSTDLSQHLSLLLASGYTFIYIDLGKNISSSSGKKSFRAAVKQDFKPT